MCHDKYGLQMYILDFQLLITVFKRIACEASEFKTLQYLKLSDTQRKFSWPILLSLILELITDVLNNLYRLLGCKSSVPATQPKAIESNHSRRGGHKCCR